MIEFGYKLERKEIKSVHSTFNKIYNCVDNLQLSGLLEEDRREICSRVAGRVSHEKQARTRSLFKLNQYGKDCLAKLIDKFSLKNI